MEPQPNKSTPARSETTHPGRLRRVFGLVLLIIGLGVALYPLFPGIQYRIKRPTPTVPYITNRTANDPLFATLGLPVLENKPIPQDNRVVIPRIGVDMPILEGATEKVLDRGGMWHLPETSTPDANGNVVLSGHRWQYLPPSAMTLYNLDKVQDGDPVFIYWRGKEYTYTITGRETINPDQVEILAPTDGPRLTIFTCTPVYSTKYRLVLYGQLIT